MSGHRRSFAGQRGGPLQSSRVKAKILVYVLFAEIVFHVINPPSTARFVQAIFKITIANFNSFRLDLLRVYDKRFMDEMKGLNGLPVFHSGYFFYTDLQLFLLFVFSPYNAYGVFALV